MNPVRIAFIFQVPSFWPSWETLYESCVADGRFDVRLFWIDAEKGDKAQMESAESFLAEKRIPYEPFSYDGIMGFLPHYMVYQTPYDKGHRGSDTWSVRYKRKGIRIIYIPYGIEISDTEESRYKHFSLPVILNAFAIYTLSEDMKKEYEKYCMNAKSVRVLGMPRFDSLLKPYGLPEEVEKKADGRKIIVWKVHFPKIFIENGMARQTTPDLEEYLKFTGYIAVRQDLFFIFLAHPKFADETIEPALRIHAARILEELGKLPNVHIDTGADYRNSLTNADAVMVDRSAVMVEAGARGVPVLYLHHADYREPMTPPVQRLLDSYVQGTACADMEQFCDMVGKTADAGRNMSPAFRECVPFGDGKCAERIREDLWQEAQRAVPAETPPKMRRGDKVILFGGGRYWGCLHGGLSKKRRPGF